MTEVTVLAIYIAAFVAVFLFGAFILKRGWEFWGGTLVGVSGLALSVLVVVLML